MVVGGEDEWRRWLVAVGGAAAQVVETIGAEDLGRREVADGQPHRPFGEHAACDPGGG